MADLMIFAVVWLHGFGGGCFVGLLVGLSIGYGNRKHDSTALTGAAKEVK